MKAVTVELVNDFHNTTATVLSRDGKTLTYRQLTDARRKLCPGRRGSCLCGGIRRAYVGTDRVTLIYFAPDTPGPNVVIEW